MPNILPENLPYVRTPWCGSGQCVDITPTDGGFLFTSTIEGNEGHVLYTPAEIASFLADVKAGRWDAIHEAATRQAAKQLQQV